MACRTSFGKWRCHRISLAFTHQRRPFSALESIFISVVSALEAEMVFIRNLVGGLLAELEDDINHDKFKRLLHYSRRLTSFQNRVKLVLSKFRRPLNFQTAVDARLEQVQAAFEEVLEQGKLYSRSWIRFGINIEFYRA
jgi:hypothetical protein